MTNINMKGLRAFAVTGLLLAICQVPLVSAEEATTDAASPSERTYSFFYDQGDHLKELVEAKQYEQASALYQKYQVDFFTKKGDKYDALLDQLANGLNESHKESFEQAKNNLDAHQANIDPATWASAVEANTKAKKLLDAFVPHEIVCTGARRSVARDELAASLQNARTSWEETAPVAFAAYDVDRNFFEVYPIIFDDQPTFLAKAFERVLPNLQTGGKDAVLSFFKIYKDALAATENGQVSSPFNQLSNLYVGLLVQSQPTDDALKSALSAIKEAQEQGFKPTEVAGINFAFVEVTSKTLLKEGQIEFPVGIDVDLPFKTTKMSLDEALASGSSADYVLAVDVNLASTRQRALNREEKPSQFLAGTREVPNPAYEPARMAVYQAQSAVSSNQNQYCYGYGCLGKAIAAIPLAVKLKEAQESFSQTPMTLTEPVYKDYEYSVSNVDSLKNVTSNYYIIDVRKNQYYKSTFDVNEKKSFRVAYNLNGKDRNLDSLSKEYEKEEAVSKFNDAPVTIRLSDVLGQFVKKSHESKPLKNLVALRGEMLSDKNLALASYQKKAEGQSATTINDPRFDSVVVILNPKGSLGSGFYVSQDLVLTNYHVIEGAHFVEMKLHNGLETFGKVVKSDVRLDLALVKVQARGQPVEFFHGSIPLGSTVEAIGHPQGLEFTITRGVVSALRKKPSPFGIGGKEVLFVQTDTPINPGNSGGPLFLNNAVIGVNDNKYVDRGIEGIAFSIHYTEVEDFITGGF